MIKLLIRMGVLGWIFLLGMKVGYEWEDREPRVADRLEPGQPAEGALPVGQTGVCHDGAEIVLGLCIREEGRRPADRYGRPDTGGRGTERRIIAGLPEGLKRQGGGGPELLTPYSCLPFPIRRSGGAATDVEHMVAFAEAVDSGLAPSQAQRFVDDLLNLTVADPDVNRHEKSDADAAGWMPARNAKWFAARVVLVKRKWGLSADRREIAALAAALDGTPPEQVGEPACAA